MDPVEILEAVDILEYISQYTDFEEKNGEYWALSPLKEENTPSFSVNTNDQVFYDFSSGAGGDVIEFVQKYHKCGFNKALEILYTYAKIDSSTPNPERPVRHLPCTKVMQKYGVKNKVQKQSKTSDLGDSYMSRFDGSPERTKSWEDEGISREVLENFQVRYDQFSNRIVFPIRDTKGKIINVCGRTLDLDFKAKGIRKYTYFHPLGILDTMFGFYENRQPIIEKHEIILFEGAKSVMLAASWGWRNTSAILTSHLNPHQFRILAELGVDVVFALDKDVNIWEDDQIAKLKRYCNVSAVVCRDDRLEDKMAPVDAGRETWENLYAERRAVR